MMTMMMTMMMMMMIMMKGCEIEQGQVVKLSSCMFGFFGIFW